jgi:chromate reductase, NAD(P)H dehydrogenase (quinone)
VVKDLERERLVKIVAVSGSTRRNSHNTNLLRAAAELAPHDVELVLWDGLKELPHYDQDDDLTSYPAVEDFRSAIAGADGVLFATPEYNSSIPGSLKNALDWASRPLATNAFRNKPVAVIGSSPGMFGAVWAQAELRKVLAAMGARVAQIELPVARAHEKIDEDGFLHDEETRELLRDAVATLADAADARERALAVAA